MAEYDEHTAADEAEIEEGEPTLAAEPSPTETPDWEQMAQERYDQLVRLKADFENYRRRVDRDQEDMKGQITGAVLVSMLPVYDNLDRALKLIPTEGEAKAWRVGMEMTLKGFEDALGKLGVEPIMAEGKPFDPKFHEAIAREESEKPEGIVLEELVKGFRWRERVIRASLVKVSAGSRNSQPAGGFDA